MLLRGTPVLAYSTCNATSPSSCSLAVKCSETPRHATISLRFSIPTAGFDKEQLFTPSPGSIAPKRSSDSRFHQLVNLARATEVHILFDYNWLHQHKHEQFEHIIAHPEEFTGRNSVDLYDRLVDWTAFSPVEDAVAEAPPLYADVSGKRPRQAATSLTPESSPRKRVLLSPPLFSAPSPTEEATTVPTLSPAPPSSPIVNAPNFQEVIRNEVETLLPTILPDILQRIFAVPSSSPSPSRSSPNSNPNHMHSLRTLISAQLAQAKTQLEKIHADTVDHLADLRSTADEEFREQLEHHRIDITMLKDDGIMELRCAFTAELEEFRADAAEMVENLKDDAEKVYADTRERLNELVGMERAHLRRAREVLDGDRQRFEERQRGTGQATAGGQVRRAVSLPL